MEKLMRIPELFDYSKAQGEINDNFIDSILAFKRIVFLMLIYEHDVSILESDCTGTIESRNGRGSTEVRFRTGETVGCKMLLCEIANSGHIHFSILKLNDRGENTTPRCAWEKIHNEPLNQRYEAEDYWQSSEQFSEFLPIIATALKK
jgi:hypothetical protein